jgi:predicted acyl esterase
VKLFLAPLALALAALVPAAAQAAPPAPFGHACVPKSGVRFCQTQTDANRVASFDGVPLDVDVTLPANGDGPFPAIVMMHGWGGDKRSFQAQRPPAAGEAAYNDLYFAGQGYAVVTYSARGFGRSCGKPDSRTAPACDRGWVHLADQRYEARDTQHLLGLLVDEGVVRADAIGVTGISYGGIQSHNLARLRDRIRLPGGSYRPWLSPNGTKLAIAAAWPRWGATDLTYALTPNGRFLDFGPFSARQSRVVPGVKKQSYNAGLYLAGNLAGFYAPRGADPTADLSAWQELTDRGEPYRSDVRAIARELSTYHSAVGVSGVPAPLLVENGWTDDLFPAPEALRALRAYRGLKGARVTLQLGDLGHPRGSNKANTERVFNRQGAAFLAAHLKGEGRAPADGAVTAFTQTCPRDAAADGPYRARSWKRLHPGRVTLAGRRTRAVTAGGGNPKTGEAFDKVISGDACVTVEAERARGTAVLQRRVRKRFTLLGLPTVRAAVRTRGRGGYLAARLWDVHGGRQLLVSRGVYRLKDDERGRVIFQLFGNGWRFERGHAVKLELLGNDRHYLRTSNFKFRARISKLRMQLPTRER